MKTTLIYTALLLLTFSCNPSTDSASSGTDVQSPNVVVIFIDDEGYGDVGVYGATGFETPKGTDNRPIGQLSGK